MACCRNLWDQTSSAAQRAVEVAEQFADAAANERALARAGTAAGLVVSGVRMAGHQWAAFACHPRALYAAHSAAYAARQAFSAGFFFPETERAVQAQFLHDIVGNPFHSETFPPNWRAWRGGLLPGMALQIYEARDFTSLGILADALEDAGCDNAGILAHLRSPGPHVRGCWVVDLLLGKE